MNHPAFSGNPQRYRQLALLLGLGTHAYLYAGMVLIAYGWRGETWIFGWKPIAITVVAALLLARYSYVTLMGLDARYGSGARWTLRQREVKLPESN